MSHAVVKHLNVYVQGRMFASALFFANHDRFRIGKFCVLHILMFVRRNVLCRTAITVPAVRIHNACS